MKKIIITLLITTAILIVFSCKLGPQHHANNRCAAKYWFPDQTLYSVYPNATTAKNIAVDTSGQNINLQKIDRLTDEVEACLSKTFGSPPVLNQETMQAASCTDRNLIFPIPRECLTVKVANDWFISQYEYNGSKHQELPYTNGSVCTDKGLPAGVCYYRAGIQDQLTIAVPPSFYVYKDPLVRIITGCKFPWSSPALAACMQPTTNPLDNGMQP